MTEGPICQSSSVAPEGQISISRSCITLCDADFEFFTSQFPGSFVELHSPTDAADGVLEHYLFLAAGKRLIEIEIRVV